MQMQMTYRLPTKDDKEALMEYVQEHYDYGETKIHACMSFTTMEFDEWLDRVYRLNKKADNEWGRSDLYMVFFNDSFIGLINVRYEMAQELAEIYGHIGYSVRPSARRMGFATEMLRFGLKVMEDHGCKEAILGCIKPNIASARTMIRNGGQLIREGDGFDPNNINQYYRFLLNKPQETPELWDLYTKDKQISGKSHTRGVWPIPDGYYHMIVHVWIRNSKGEYSMSQRAATRPSHPLEWECVGGSVLKGETSLQAAIREIKEEIGLDLTNSDGRLIFSQLRDRIKKPNNVGYLDCRDIMEVYLFDYDGDIDLRKATTDEVVQTKWMTIDEIRNLYDDGKMVYTLDYFFTKIGQSN